MASGPDRRTFLRGAAGAVGMGAVGALSTRLELGAASRPADKAQAVRKIQVLLVPNGGKKAGMSLFVPPASAAVKDEVEWVATTPNIEKIHKIAFNKPPQPPVPNPFSETVSEFTNTSGTNNLKLTVLDDAAEDEYHYTIWVKQVSPGGMHKLDPDLDIVG